MLDRLPTRKLFVAMTVLALAATLSACQSLSASNARRTYSVTLTGSQQVPPVQTQATGNATFIISPDGQSIAYDLRVNDIQAVTMAHIHLGSAGENGKPVVVLYPTSTSTAPPSGLYTGTLVTGTITQKDLIGPYAGKPLSTLISAFKHGLVYVNVHTRKHPGGAIRGQIRP